MRPARGQHAAPARSGPGRRKFRALAWLAALCLCAAVGVAGCSSGKPKYIYTDPADLKRYKTMATAIEEPAVAAENYLDHFGSAPPLTIDHTHPVKYLNLELRDCILLALKNSEVMRNLGVNVLSNPELTSTVYDPAIVDTDPRFGVEAALSAFDASFAASAFFEKNDRALNNVFLGGGTTLLRQDLINLQRQLTKRTASGTELVLRHNTEYDANNAPGNQFPSVWETMLEVEARQPLLQGAGVKFNRINGPGQTPGFANGVLIARINTDVTLADFQLGVRNLVADVENAYWDLYFAYRDLDAKKRARDSALETWRRIHALFVADREGGEAEKEAQARSQYFRFEEQVQTSLSGGTRASFGVAGRRVIGSTIDRFTEGGVQVIERRLRLLVGLPINDGHLIRPCQEPPMAKVLFDWDEVMVEALARRTELRRQKWQIKRRELEVVAAKNFLLPRLDVMGRYRWRGLGRDLLDPERSGRPQFDNAWAELTGGDFQEWQLGAELSFPIGQRQAHAALRNAKWHVARERARLKEQERFVMHELSEAWAAVPRAYAVAQTNYNRRIAARQQVEATQAAFEADETTLDQLLEGQRFLADAERAYYASLVEYVRAVTAVHFAKGSLLEYDGVFLSEGPWPARAYRDAARRDHLRVKALRLEDYTLHKPILVSRGEYPQKIAPPHPPQPDKPPLIPGIDAPPIEPYDTAPPEVVPPPKLSPPLPPAPLPGSF